MGGPTLEIAMRTRILAAAALILATLLVARASLAGDEQEATVAAKRYRIVWADSGMDLVHGGGRWVHELYLPDAKLVATLVPDGMSGLPTLHVRPAEKPRNDLTGLHPSALSPIEDVRVPADLAKRIRELGELTNRYQEMGSRLGQEARSRLSLEPIPKESGG
jgi:hypothetical protein